VAFSSAIMAIITNSIHFNFLESIDDRYFSLVVFTLIIIPLISFLISLILLGGVLITRDYRGILIDKFTENKTKQQEDKIASVLVDTYRENLI
jgi:phosphate/sulfate permease